MHKIIASFLIPISLIAFGYVLNNYLALGQHDSGKLQALKELLILFACNVGLLFIYYVVD